MTEKPWGKKGNDRDIDRLFNELSDSERKHLEGVWDETVGHDDINLEISEEETEEALASVHKQLDFGQEKSQKNGNIFSLKRFSYLLAAAAVVISLGIGYLLTNITVNVPYGETASLELPDGSVAELNSGTELHYNRMFGYLNRDIHLNGEAYFDVITDETAFLVHSNGLVAEVAGTQFNIKSWSDDPRGITAVAVMSGVVQFFPSDSPSRSVTLTEGLASSIDNTMAVPARPEPVTPEIAMAWRNQNLAFLSEPLHTIFRELERKFDIRIEITDSEIGTNKLTTFYSAPGDVESVLNDICSVMGLTYTESANGYRISLK